MILGFDASDDKKIALEMLHENGATFPNIIDSSDAAMKVCFQQYQGRYGSAVPMNYIIDRDGKVVDAWYGGGREHPKAIMAMRKIGGQLADAIRQEMDEQAAKAAPEVAAAARRLFQVLRDADYDHEGISTRDWKHHPAKEINYNPDRNDRGWVHWVCEKFKANPNAFECCRKRNRDKKLTLCGKTNVLTYAFDLWQRVFNEVAAEYPDIKTDYAHVDAICMWMVKNPEWFDVIVTDNMFGDIITDLGAMIQGGMGIAAGGNINPNGVSMFEPIGGSAPKYTGLNVINPIAAIAAAQMMLDHLGENDAARLIENAIKKVVSGDIKCLSAGQMGCSTSEVGDLVVQYINA